MASEWYYSRDGQESGPVSSAELKTLASNGDLLQTDYLWKEGMAEWRLASDFPKLFPDDEPATVEITPDEAPREDPLASLQIDVAPKRTKATKPKQTQPAADPLASLKVDFNGASKRATTAVKSHAKAAGKIASLTAERTKLSTVTLPIAYAALGEHCYQSRTHAEAFPDLFAKLDAIQVSLSNGEHRVVEKSETIADTAMAWAEQGMKFAQSQAQGVQAKTLFVQLGKACVDQFGLDAGPEDLVAKVQALKERVAKISTEVASSVKSSGGAKTWLVYGGAAFLCLAILGAFTNKQNPGRRGGDGGRDQTSGRSSSRNNDNLAGCPRGVSGEYKAGWERALSSVYGYHEHLIQFRKRVDSGVLVEKHLETEIKTMHDWVSNHLEWLRERARESGMDEPKGEADGYEYGMRRIIKSRY